jgi:hypothetical protein
MNGLSEIIAGSGALFLVFSAAGFAVYLLLLNKAPALGRTVAKTMAVGALSGLAFHAGRSGTADRGIGPVGAWRCLPRA